RAPKSFVPEQRHLDQRGREPCLPQTFARRAPPHAADHATKRPVASAERANRWRGNFGPRTLRARFADRIIRRHVRERCYRAQTKSILDRQISWLAQSHRPVFDRASPYCKASRAV